MADTDSGLAGISVSKEVISRCLGGTQVRGRFGRNFLEWQRRPRLRRIVESKEGISRFFGGRKTRAGNRVVLHRWRHVAIPLCYSPQKIKSFRKGKGGAGERGQPFFKRVSPFPRISLLSLLPILLLSLSFQRGIRYGGGDWNGIGAFGG